MGALQGRHLAAQLGGEALQPLVDRCQGLLAVDLRLAGAEGIQVGTVEHENAVHAHPPSGAIRIEFAVMCT